MLGCCFFFLSTSAIAQSIYTLMIIFVEGGYKLKDLNSLFAVQYVLSILKGVLRKPVPQCLE